MNAHDFMACRRLRKGIRMAVLRLTARLTQGLQLRIRENAQRMQNINVMVQRAWRKTDRRK